VFICSACNAEVENPAYVWSPPWRSWRTDRGWHYPVCPSGHCLIHYVIGKQTELSLPLSFLRGFSLSLVCLVYAIVQDLRWGKPGNHLLVVVAAAMMVGWGLLAWGYAWTWAGRTGPVHRLTSRACGVAFGFLVPALIAGHALFFNWLAPFERFCGSELARLFA
jgi:hypothetical protein